MKDFDDIMSTSSSNGGYTKLIKIDNETDPNLPQVLCKKCWEKSF